jgi:hypothetical protein
MIKIINIETQEVLEGKILYKTDMDLIIAKFSKQLMKDQNTALSYFDLKSNNQVFWYCGRLEQNPIWNIQEINIPKNISIISSKKR